MGELIHIREKALRRDIARSNARDRESLKRAVHIIKENLHATAVEIVDAPAHEQAELLDRAENFIALIRYGMRMLGEDSDEPGPPLSIDKT
jgi:hypothetical protein